MSTATAFKALALYPGGQGLCGIVFSDPGITLTDSVRKVNVSRASIEPLLWNLEDWDLELYSDFSVSDGTDTAQGLHYCTGRWQSLTASYDKFSDNLQYSLISTNSEPKDRICGTYGQRSYAIEGGVVINDTTGTTSAPRLLIGTNLSYVIDGTSGAYSENHTGSLSTYGDFDWSIGGITVGNPHSFSLAITPFKIWIKNNGTCDIYFNVSVVFSDDFFGAFGNDTTYGGSVGSSFSVTYLGGTFTVPLYGPSGFTVSFSAFIGLASSTIYSY